MISLKNNVNFSSDFSSDTSIKQKKNANFIVQKFRSSEVQKFRSSEVQKFRSSEVQNMFKYVHNTAINDIV
jgi:hypothetical protein